jgi:Domain of unknown function (DUF5655)
MEKLSAIRTKNETITLWNCPKSKKLFNEKNLSPSCEVYSFKNHFKGKENCQSLFEKLIQSLKDHIQRFYVNTIEPCIHLCAQSTFAAVKTMEDKIRVEFDLPFEVQSQRFIITTQMPTHRFLYCVDINKESDINAELMLWLRKAYEVKEL